jgi:hypothetical protein
LEDVMGYSIYFAGDLFDHKHLTGNALLSEAIEEVSSGAYECLLPQNLEQTETRALDVRNQDLRAVLECDLALFNFDGPDLDSGTVAEFMFAKSVDIPAVLLRTDFRYAGDQSGGGEPWNLMLSGYPRTKTVRCHGMELYQATRRYGGIKEMHREIAREIVAAFDEILANPPLLRPDEIEEKIRWAVAYAGGGLDQVVNESLVREIAARKGNIGSHRAHGAAVKL